MQMLPGSSFILACILCYCDDIMVNVATVTHSVNSCVMLWKRVGGSDCSWLDCSDLPASARRDRHVQERGLGRRRKGIRGNGTEIVVAKMSAKMSRFSVSEPVYV